MEIIEGDLLSIKVGIVAHQCNTQGVMGAGLAAKIRAKYPQVFERYKYFCDRGEFNLGAIQLVRVSNSPLYICNIAAQDRYGRNQQHTNYLALEIALRKLHAKSQQMELQVYLPWGMGAGFGGGDFGIIKDIIAQECRSAIFVKFSHQKNER